MGQKKLIWQLYPSYLVVTFVAMLAVTAYCSHCLRRVYTDQVHEELHRLAGFAADEVRVLVAAGGTDQRDGDPNAIFRIGDPDALCRQLGRLGTGRIRLSIIAPSGIVLGDSHKDPQAMEDHAGRPEIREALEKGHGSSVRFSPTLDTQMMYVAVAVRKEEGKKVGREEGKTLLRDSSVPTLLPSSLPTFLPSSSPSALPPPGAPIAVVRAAAPLTEIDRALWGIYAHMLWAGLIVAAGAAVLSLLISRRISRPLVGIQRVAERFAAGELNLRMPMPPSAELAALAGSLNQMATQLGERITTITEQRNELDAVLSSMAEGVFAVDNRGRIASLNPAAAQLLGLDPVRAQARPVEEVLRNVELQEFVRQTLAGVPPGEADISLPTGPEGRSAAGGGRSFRLHGAGLTDARGRRSGAVIVLNDMTRIRRLEAVRRDFVANVSHELKTPVTSIQGFVEALTDGGIHDPTQVERYLGIIARHAARLNSIIDDLLTLSRLEEAGERRSLNFETGPVRPVLEEAIHLSGVRADEKRMTIDLVCDADLEARINPPLLEQAVMNLIDNAIKYSPEGGRIRVAAGRTGTHVSVAVTDEGCGIGAEHLTRIFERFYVVDKSRSRKLGGTGLGLAIVKHIAQAHGGRVTVASTPGQGSTFTLHLPV